MASSHYARLGRDHATIDVPLSRLSSTSDVYKLPDHQSTFASQDSVIRFKKRGFFGAINGWWLELGSIGLAIAVMLVTIVLLAHYDRKELSETPRRPNLNTLVNIFSTIEASLLVFVAAESGS
jgi:negative regulator of sigma E activity